MTSTKMNEALLDTLEFDSEAGELRMRNTGRITDIKACPGCGVTFLAGGRGLGKNFCSDPCRTKFHARCKSEGGPMASLVKAWTLTRHAKPGSEEAEICRFARSQITQIAQHFIEMDEDAGRPSAIEYVASLMASGTLWVDRAR